MSELENIIDFQDSDIQVVFPERYSHMNENKWKIKDIEHRNDETRLILESNLHWLTGIHKYSPIMHVILIDKVPEWSEQVKQFISESPLVPYTKEEMIQAAQDGDMNLVAIIASALDIDQRIKRDVEDMGGSDG